MILKKFNRTKVKDIVQAMEKWAPGWAAEKWDKIGLIVGNPESDVKIAWTALELTPHLLKEALNNNVDMLLVHHSPLFKPITRLNTNDPSLVRLIEAINGKLAIFVAHTNLDKAPGGVNDIFAQILKLTNVKVLVPSENISLTLLTTFVPSESLKELKKHLLTIGTNQFEEYHCGFRAQENGSFYANIKNRPHEGKIKQKNHIQEKRLEMIIPTEKITEIIKAIKEKHPYEEPLYFTNTFHNSPPGFGMGRIGELQETESINTFIKKIAHKFNSPTSQMTSSSQKEIKKIAVVGGSGSNFLKQAAFSKAEVFITGEANYHDWEKANDLNICLITLGHYQTEVIIVKPWAQYLKQTLNSAGFLCKIIPWTYDENPWSPILN